MNQTAVVSDNGRAACTEDAPCGTYASERTEDSLRILLAEDTPDLQLLIATLLRSSFGATVAVAGNGEEAVSMAWAAQRGAQPFDLILMDMQMPVVDGYAATKQLRREGYRGRVIALTAHAMTGDREKCLEAGCNDYLTKPISPDRLAAVVRRWTGRGASPPKHASAPRETAKSMDDQVLLSEYADRPVIARLLGDFVSRLDGRLSAIQTAQCESNGEELRRLAHQLKGSAGSYGYPSLSAAAKALEDAARGGRLQETPAIITQISLLCRAITRGWNSPLTTGNEDGTYGLSP